MRMLRIDDGRCTQACSSVRLPLAAFLNHIDCVLEYRASHRVRRMPPAKALAAARDLPRPLPLTNPEQAYFPLERPNPRSRPAEAFDQCLPPWALLPSQATPPCDSMTTLVGSQHRAAIHNTYICP